MKALVTFLSVFIMGSAFSSEPTSPKANFANKRAFFEQFATGQAQDTKKPTPGAQIQRLPPPKPTANDKTATQQTVDKPVVNQRTATQRIADHPPSPQDNGDDGCKNPVSAMEEQIKHRCFISEDSLQKRFKACRIHHLKGGSNVLPLDLQVRRLDYLSSYMERIAEIEKENCNYVSFYSSGDAAQAIQLSFSKIIEDILSEKEEVTSPDTPGTNPRESMEYQTVKDFKRGLTDAKISLTNPKSTNLTSDKAMLIRQFISKIASVSLSLLDTASGDSSFDFFITHKNVELNLNTVTQNLMERLQNLGVKQLNEATYKGIFQKFERLIDKVLIHYLVHKDAASSLVYLSKPWGLPLSGYMPPAISITTVIKDFQNLTKDEFEQKYKGTLGGILSQIEVLRSKGQFQARILTTSPLIQSNAHALKFYLYYAPTERGSTNFKEEFQEAYQELALQIMNDLLVNNVTSIHGKPLNRGHLIRLKNSLEGKSPESSIDNNDGEAIDSVLPSSPPAPVDSERSPDLTSWDYAIADEIKTYFLQKYEDLVKVYNAQAQSSAQQLKKYAPHESSKNVRPEHKEVTRNIQGVKYSVPRPNHGLAHGLRQGFLAVDILTALSNFDVTLLNEDDVSPEAEVLIRYVKELLKEPGYKTLEEFQAVASFMKSGRIDEADGTSTYRTALQRDAVNFYKFAQKHPRIFSEFMRRVYALTLLWGENPSNDLKVLDPHVEDVVETFPDDIVFFRNLTLAAHRFDLGRLPTLSYILDNKRSACLAIFNNDPNLSEKSYKDFPSIIQNMCDNLWERAREYLIATGDHHYDDNGNWKGHDDKFFLLAANPHQMVDALEKARRNSKITDFFSPLEDRKSFNPH